MIKDQCGIIINVDNEIDIPEDPPIGKLYFTNDTKKIKGNLGNGLIEYSKVPIIGNSRTLVAEATNLTGSGKIGTTDNSVLSYTTIEDGYYYVMFRFYWTDTASGWVDAYITINGMIESLDSKNTYNQWVIVSIGPRFISMNTNISLRWVGSRTFNITDAIAQIYKYDTNYI